MDSALAAMVAQRCREMKLKIVIDRRRPRRRRRRRKKSTTPALYLQRSDDELRARLNCSFLRVVAEFGFEFQFMYKMTNESFRCDNRSQNEKKIKIRHPMKLNYYFDAGLDACARYVCRSDRTCLPARSTCLFAAEMKMSTLIISFGTSQVTIWYLKVITNGNDVGDGFH